MSRSLIAWLIGLFGILTYVVVVMILGDWVLETHWSIQLIYFGLAGIAWVWPAKWLIYWSLKR